jgi:hypothetical protein
VGPSRGTKGRHVKAQDGYLPSFLLETGASQPREPHGGDTRMERLLLVEHEPLFGEGLALLLEWRTGLGCVLARSLAEARTTLEEANRKPACVVVDLALPEGQGTAVLEELDRVPVLALIDGRNVHRQD